MLLVRTFFILSDESFIGEGNLLCDEFNISIDISTIRLDDAGEECVFGSVAFGQELTDVHL